jgi:hypothetical protein
MADYPSAPQSVSGLDTSGQFHIGSGVTIGSDGGYIRIMAAGHAVRATPESLACLILNRYFPADQIQA